MALLLDDEEENRNRKRRFAVHKMLRKRTILGEYWTLFRQLMDDEEKFFQYFRMSMHDFNVLLGKIEKSIKKTEYHFQGGYKSKRKTCSMFKVSILF